MKSTRVLAVGFAQAIAEKIYQVSEHSQVLCISHLPQVAAMADTHLFIMKETVDGRTRTLVRTLEHNEKDKGSRPYDFWS